MKERSWFRYGLSGAAAGLVNGLFGAGGGMVLVPMLSQVGTLEEKKAFSSAICIILPLCLVSITVYCLQRSFPWAASLPYLAGGLLGGLLGGLVFRKVSAQLLHRLLGLVIIWGGLRLLL